ncbi:ABC transporter ATP-binding protein [Halomonas sp. BC04]|uniref:ABC transporter ATP-binding protein n=1 Tax=Halomonas sp. BC04 TaxID=1403540 RepID=UPI0004B116DB|nr:oligopeptide/dipeptide ABC transporter ATP-binding protein [Halomonas sp. BC04]
MSKPQPLLEIDGLYKSFDVGKRRGFRREERLIHAANDVNLTIAAGTTLGLVGESGSGKSTLARLVLKLADPSGGDIRFDGESILGMKGAALKRFRQQVQMVFQDPYGSLNPRMNVEKLISEGWVVNPELRPASPKQRVAELMEQVGLRPEWSNRYPGQFSGGQRQRIGIARALAVNPKLLVCDEAVSALDVSVQAQILKLLKEIQQETGVAYLFISHDLSVVRHVSDQVAVMHLGRIIEHGDANEVYDNAVHPYTQALLSAVPRFGSSAMEEKPRLAGEPPDPGNPPSGCMFRTRCWRAKPKCAEKKPALERRGESHLNACHFPGPWIPAANVS